MSESLFGHENNARHCNGLTTMRTTSSKKDVMTTREVGKVLGVAVRTVQLWVEAGVLPAWRTAGGHRRIARSAVDKLLLARRNDLAPELAHNSTVPTALKLLIVEGDAHMRTLLQAIVRKWTFPVELAFAADGFEALVRIGELAPDVLLTDLTLPDLDAMAMLRALRRPPLAVSAPICIALSALTPTAIAQRGGLPKDVTCFKKPLHYGQLETLLQRCLQHKLRILGAVA